MKCLIVSFVLIVVVSGVLTGVRHDQSSQKGQTHVSGGSNKNKLFGNLKKSPTSDLYLKMIKYVNVTGDGFVKSMGKSQAKHGNKVDVDFILKKNNYIINKTLDLIDTKVSKEDRLPALMVLAQYYVAAENDDRDAYEDKFEEYIDYLRELKKILRHTVPFEELSYFDAQIDSLLHVRGHLDFPVKKD